ncbi:MAG: hypothetical protein AB4080_06380 [Trichodesmium sp.]
MNIQETVIEQMCEQLEIDPNNHDQQFSVEELKDIIRCTTNKMLMAHFQILLEKYLDHTDKNTALNQLSAFAEIVSESKHDPQARKSLNDFQEIAKQIAKIEVKFLETSLGLET